METRQLVLIDSNGSDRAQWRLDERTREVGREGIAAARRALQDALTRHAGDGGNDNEDTQSTAA